MESGSRRLYHLGSCLAASLALTLSAVALDFQRASVQQTQNALNLARQVASQAEGLTFKAKESGERDPLEWAVNYLSQGVEPRLVHVTRAQLADASSQNLENYVYRANREIFEFSKVFSPENGAGVRVSLSLGYLGFLGSKSAAASDLMILLFFWLGFAIVFLTTGRLFGFDDTSKIRLLVSHWVGGAKAQLTRHGIHVREMVRQSQRLAACSGHSRQLVGELRDKIHEGISGLHESREFFKEGETIAARAETLALNMAIEANRLGGDARRIADMATELHRRIQALHAVNRKSQVLVQNLERSLEPWSADADLAHQAFDDIKEATDLLGKHIRSTTESLLGQAKLIQGLNLELGPRQAQNAVVSAPSAAVAMPHAAVGPDSAVTAGAAAPAPFTPPPQPQLPSPQGHRLPDPLPPIDETASRPLFKRLRAKKIA